MALLPLTSCRVGLTQAKDWKTDVQLPYTLLRTEYGGESCQYCPVCTLEEGKGNRGRTSNQDRVIRRVSTRTHPPTEYAMRVFFQGREKKRETETHTQTDRTNKPP